MNRTAAAVNKKKESAENLSLTLKNENNFYFPPSHSTPRNDSVGREKERVITLEA
jgi:hypothetical protein